MATELSDPGVLFADGSLLVAVPRGYIDGLTLSTAGASATMSVADGMCTDSTAAATFKVTAKSKTTSAWAAGSAVGGLDTGAIAINTWYHWFAIWNPTTKASEILFSLSPTAPTMPAGYTKFRRIGSGKTNGSAQWATFIQYGNTFLWDSEVTDANGNAPTTGTLLTTSVPTGVNVEGIYVIGSNTAGSLALRISSPAVSDQAPTQTNSQIQVSTSYTQQAEPRVFTNTLAQIRVRGNNAYNYILSTKGWVDSRGKDA